MIATLRPKPPKPEIFYPESDDRNLWVKRIFTRSKQAGFFEALRSFFKAERDVYVAMDNFLYFQEGNPSAVISPDVYVVKARKKSCVEFTKSGKNAGTFRMPSLKLRPQVPNCWTSAKKKTLRRPRCPGDFPFRPVGRVSQAGVARFSADGRKLCGNCSRQRWKHIQRGIETDVSSRTPGWLRVIDPRTGKVVPRYEEMDTALDSQTASPPPPPPPPRRDALLKLRSRD